MHDNRQQSPPAAVAADSAAIAAASSSASSTTQDSSPSKLEHRKRSADILQLQQRISMKRPRQAFRYAVAPAAATNSSSSSTSSSCSTDDTADTAMSVQEPLTAEKAQQLYAAVEAGQQSLESTLLLVLCDRGQKAFVSFLQYVLHNMQPLRQQQQQQAAEVPRPTSEQQQQQQQQQQYVGYQLFNALAANNYSLFSHLSQILSDPDLVTCYKASAAFQGLAEAVIPAQVLAAILAAPHGVQLLLAALNEDRLHYAFEQGYVITVCYAGRACEEPLCSGTVGFMISNARRSDLEGLVRQLMAALSCQDESAVAAAMALVIVARNAAAGVEVLLPHMPLLLAAVQQHWRISKRVLLTLRVMVEHAAAAAAAGQPAAAVAMTQHDLTPLANLLLTNNSQLACLAVDIILLLAKAAPAHPGLAKVIPAVMQLYQQQGAVSWLGQKAVDLLQLIALGGRGGTPAGLPQAGHSSPTKQVQL